MVVGVGWHAVVYNRSGADYTSYAALLIPMCANQHKQWTCLVLVPETGEHNTSAGP